MPRMPRRAADPQPRPDRRKPSPAERQVAAKSFYLPLDQAQIRKARLAELGLPTMTDYYYGRHWSTVRDWWRRHGTTKKCCAVCGDTKYELHHRTYVRLGCERPSDLVPLCARHHLAAHELIAARTPGVTLWNAHRKLPVEDARDTSDFMALWNGDAAQSGGSMTPEELSLACGRARNAGRVSPWVKASHP